MRYFHLVWPITVAGCTAGQLSYNTLNMSSVLGGVAQQQALDNLARFVAEPYSLPSELYVSSGTAQVTNSVTPTITFPLSSSFASVFNGSKTTTTAGGGATLGASVGWQLSFGVSPIIETTSLRNLSILYRAVVRGPDGIGDLIYNYQPPQVFGPGNTLYPDPYYIQYSNCVFCVYFPADAETPARAKTAAASGPFNDIGLVDNDSLRTYFKKIYGCDRSDDGDPQDCRYGKREGMPATINDVFTHAWLYYDSPAKGGNKNKLPAGSKLQEIGRAGDYTFSVVDSVDNIPGKKLFADFVLLTFPLSPAADRSKSDIKASSTQPAAGQQPGKEGAERHLPLLGGGDISEGQKAKLTQPPLILPLLPP